MSQYFIMSMLKVTLGSETVPSATLSHKFCSILVISNDVLFFASRVCYQHKRKTRLLGTKCFTFSEIIHEFCL